MPYKSSDVTRTYFRERARRKRAEDPAESNRVAREWHARNADKVKARYSPLKNRAWRLLRQYGLTLIAWEAMFNGQDRRCAICKSVDPGTKKGWHTDHDHETGIVRGILCMGCNTALGLLGDSSAAVASRLKVIKEYI